MRRAPHENVATVLVAPSALPDLELALMSLDLRAWPVRTAPICSDGARQEFQLRRRLVESRRGAWDDAAAWTPIWISFGESWRSGEDPLPWAAHQALWDLLAEYAPQVRYAKRLGGVPKLSLPQDVSHTG
ncbi:hypothetical protein [Nocardioides marmorisolisilvae]|uniref:Uncharacterized protein n=1 Tax=Nocardioides marmorisolisilvae TaxID=1542737 RepID=A0A3N0DRX4_9ACTN|nr:hypothetical protein [Nocardioides marmorisolisilvae]RNL78375.1 hypothetical protein EFL95_04535 [Nocardioides marmorisolisilvae]